MKIAFISLFVISSLILFAGAGCTSETNYQTGRAVEPENPYNSGSGHSAGYEWAERTGGACTGKSSSFNEGCEEYYRQNQ